MLRAAAISLHPHRLAAARALADADKIMQCGCHVDAVGHGQPAFQRLAMGLGVFLALRRRARRQSRMQRSRDAEGFRDCERHGACLTRRSYTVKRAALYANVPRTKIKLAINDEF